MRDMNRSYI